MIVGAVLREDLVITENHDGDDHYYLVIDPVTDASYEFGEHEWFLLQAIDGQSTAEEIIGKLSASYQIELEREDFDTFVSTAAEWGLLAIPGGDDSLAEELTGRHQTESSSIYDDLIETPSLDVSSMMAQDRPFRSRSKRSRSISPETSEVNWVWFNPDAMLNRLSGLLYPLRWLRYLAPLLFAVGCLIIFNNIQEFAYDFHRFRKPLSIIQILIFSMFTMNLAAQLGKGIVMRSYRVPVDQFGIKFVVGILPRFAINAGSLDHLSRSQKLKVYTSPLLIRLAFFSLATMFWLMTRTTGTLLPGICLVLLVVAVISFFLSANPLLKSEGYDTLTTLLDMPNLRQKANLALFGGENNPLAERVLQEDNAFALRAYALSSVIFIFILLGGLLLLAARWFELNYQGTGVAVYLLLTIYLIRRFYNRFVTKRAEMKDRRSKIEAAIAARNSTGRTENVSREPGTAKRSRKKSGWGKDVPDSVIERVPQWLRPHVPKRITKRHVALLVFLVVLFLPYPYETGGVLKVLPDKQYEIYAETPGVIKEVLRESGVYMKAGTVVATLSSLEQEKDLLITQASILEQQAKLEQLQSTPTEEEVALAKSRLETASTQYKYSSDSFKRVASLYKDGNVSFDDYQEEQKQMDVDHKQVLEAQANLDKVLAGPHPKEIEAAAFELSRLQEKLKYDQEEIKRTKLVMPMDGHIVTPNLDLKVGLYLDEGDYFATVENDENLRIEIQVPESDIADVKPGADARFKVWAHGDRLFYGQVSEVANVALEEDYGQMVAVIVVVPNKDRLLKSGMTGFGKVDGGSKFVIDAFTRMLVRFFTIEMWSWFP